MSWTEYRKRNIKRVTLDSFDLPEFWVDFRRLPSLTQSEMKELSELKDSSSQEDVAKVMCSFIKAWAITDPDTGTLLDISVEGMKKLPVEILTFIFGEISKTGGEIAVPPATGTSSMPS